MPECHSSPGRRRWNSSSGFIRWLTSCCSLACFLQRRPQSLWKVLSPQVLSPQVFDYRSACSMPAQGLWIDNTFKSHFGASRSHNACLALRNASLHTAFLEPQLYGLVSKRGIAPFHFSILFYLSGLLLQKTWHLSRSQFWDNPTFVRRDRSTREVHARVYWQMSILQSCMIYMRSFPECPCLMMQISSFSRMKAECCDSNWGPLDDILWDRCSVVLLVKFWHLAWV